MSWFNNLKVKAKMLVSFMLVIALMAVLAVFAISQLNSVSDTYKYAIEHPIEAETQMRIFDRAYVDMRRVTTAMDMFSVENDPARINSLHQDMVTSYNVGLEALNAYETAARSGNLSEKALAALAQVGELRKLFERYKTEVCDQVADAARVGDNERARGYSAAAGSLAGDIAESCEELIGISEASAIANIASAEDTAGSTLWIILAVAVAATLLSLIIALYISGLVSKPIATITAFMKQAGATGDISLRPEDLVNIEKLSKSKDEIGDLSNGTASFVQHVTTIAQELETIAAGDLTTEIKLLSNADKMGLSLRKMVESLNQMFGDINASTAQVSAGSKQIADGAQALAQGSTQQAASVEELSSSIAEISRMAKDNADTATETLNDTKQAGQLMGVCMEQMSQMTAAMKSIDEKSRNITRTTKVIDDIAFQTNILALNAAVEAARAGQHGKGFAVVAEEVRNLASKSADAAKETAALIESSSQSVEEGNQIVEKVNASLLSVAEIAQKNAQQTEQIQSVSSQQSAAMTQINTGIDQVAQVVQQNSATAEQSAAASEEMSGQSAMLEELISQFKLKNDGAGRSAPRASLPAAARRQISMPEKAAAADDYGKY